MKHSFDPDGIRSVGDIIKLQLQKLDNAERATIVKNMELYLEMYIDQKLVKELVMAFKSIGQRMGFVSIADAKRKGLAQGLAEGALMWLLGRGRLLEAFPPYGSVAYKVPQALD